MGYTPTIELTYDDVTKYPAVAVLAVNVNCCLTEEFGELRSGLALCNKNVDVRRHWLAHHRGQSRYHPDRAGRAL